MRELPAPDDLLLPRDRDRIRILLGGTWHCPFCDIDGPVGSSTTVIWLGKDSIGPHGRCFKCGQKYALAATWDKAFVPREWLDLCTCHHLRADHPVTDCRSCSGCAEFAPAPVPSLDANEGGG